jgi:hypothetical protein
MKIFTATIGASLILTASSPLHAVPFYTQVFESNAELFLVDADSGASSFIGFTGVNNMTDLAISAAGQLYGINLTELYSINASTAASTLIGPLVATTGMVGLDVAADGQLYGLEAGGRFFRIDTATGAAAPLFTTPFHYVGDVTHFSGNVFYATAFSSSGLETNLIEINAGSGTAVNRGQIAADIIPGLDFDLNGRLVALAASGKIYEIPAFATSGTGVLLSTSSVGMAGATTVPIPEPSTLALLLCAVVGAGFRPASKRSE